MSKPLEPRIAAALNAAAIMSPNAVTMVEVEASRARDERLDLTAADLERLDGFALEQAARLDDVFLVHWGFFPLASARRLAQ